MNSVFTRAQKLIDKWLKESLVSNHSHFISRTFALVQFIIVSACNVHPLPEDFSDASKSIFTISFCHTMPAGNFLPAHVGYELATAKELESSEHTVALCSAREYYRQPSIA